MDSDEVNTTVLIRFTASSISKGAQKNPAVQRPPARVVAFLGNAWPIQICAPDARSVAKRGTCKSRRSQRTVPNPYDVTDFGTVSLWTWDHDHATAERYYLEAPVVFGTVTGLDQRTLGENERAADDLGINPKMAAPLREVAAAEPSAERNSHREHLVPPGNRRRKAW